MALHKAPTAVTIAPTHEKSGFALWIERYWKVGLVLTVAVSAGILFRQYSRQSDREAQEANWERLVGIAPEDPSTGLPTGSPESLKAVHEQVKGTKTGPWALYLAATNALAQKQFDEAKICLDQLRREHPDHPLVAQSFSPDGKAPALSPVSNLEQRIEARRAWIQSHQGLFENPPPPADAPKVRINTDRGAIVVQLYSNLAPKHVENFLNLVREGFYSGTRFHRVVRGFLIQGGDPNTKSEDTASWGQGGPGYTLDREETGLKHFAGVLSAAIAIGIEGKSSGSQFVLTSGDAHPLDDNFVPFGKVLEGRDVVTQIDQGPIADGASDRPKDPVTVQSIEVL